MRTSLAMIHQPQHQRVQHKLVSGTSRSRVAGVLVRKSHPLRSFAHAAALQRFVVSAYFGSSFRLSATMFSEASTPLRCAGALRSIMAAYSVPFTRQSISASWHIHQANSSGVGLKVSRYAKIFLGPSVKKAFSLGRWGNNEAASVEDSVTCVSSSEGLQ